MKEGPDRSFPTKAVATLRKLASWGRKAVNRVGSWTLAFAAPGRRYRHPSVSSGEVLFSDGFETGSTSRFRFDGNATSVSVVSSPARKGLRAALMSLDRGKDKDPSRTEVIPHRVKGFMEGMFARFHQEYSYSFGMFLPEDYTPYERGECFAQWHGIPNRVLGEAYRHAPVLLAMGSKGYFIVICSSSKLVTPAGDHDDDGRYDKVVRAELGPIDGDLGRWVDWKVEVRWSYQEDGMGYLKLFKDGKLLIHDVGANCFNDLRGGPYLKLGVYNWNWNHPPRSAKVKDAPCKRYFDSIRIEAS